MKNNVLKQKLSANEGVIGVFCSTPAPAIVEMLGYLGFDFVIIDAEHGPQGIESVEHMLRAADAVGITAISRVAVNLPQNILRYLDAGSMGIQVPMVNTQGQVLLVVDAVKYPPIGKRGLAGVRASGYGLSMPTKDYVDMANDQTLVVVQIETPEAIENIKAISSVPQVDVVFIGPTDLSTSMGYIGEPTHPDVLATIEHLGRQIRSEGKIPGTIARDPQAYRYWRERGFQYLATGASSFIIEAGSHYLEQCRQQETSLWDR